MEAMDFFLTVGLAVLVSVTVFRRKRTGGGPRAAPAVPTIKVSDPTVARRMLVEHADTFSDRPVSRFPVEFVTGERVNLSHSIGTVPHGPLWRALRCNLTAGTLHPSRLGLLAPLQRDAVDGLIASLACRGEGVCDDHVIVIRDNLRTSLLTLQFRLCFGEGVDDRHVRAVQSVLHDFFDGMVDAVELASSKMARLLHWRRWRRFLAIRRRMAELILPLIAERQHRRRRAAVGDGGIVLVQPYVDSLLDLRVPSYNDGSIKRTLTDDEKVTLVWEFLGAGTENIVSCVEWALAHLVNQTEAQTKLRREVDGGDQSRHLPYLRAVILECLRLHPPMPVVEREVGAEGAEIVGETMPANSMKMRFTIVTGKIGRDSKAWTEPDEFRPDRFLAGGEGESVGPMPGPKEMKMLPFGTGTRRCPGEALGMVHVSLFLAALVREFEWRAPAKGGGSVDLTEVDGFTKHMKTPLKARITRPRK